MQFQLKIYDGGPIGGFSGKVIVESKTYNVPPKVVREQESWNTEPYYFEASYDSADELRIAARRFVARNFRARATEGAK